MLHQYSIYDAPISFDCCHLCPRGEGAGILTFKEIPFIAGLTPSNDATCIDSGQNTGMIIDPLQGYIKDPFCKA
jgi:hypothetical protein